MIHVMREGSNYGKMLPFVQNTFNETLLFQMNYNQTKMEAIRAVIDQNGMTSEAYTALTV